tara:strand:- start:10361 stop:12664 length:2304 start_codon:yes stop_codon:yes gene_type:complete
MSIKKFFINKDTTITNAFKSNLSTRGTDANMGNSDILETFSIFGQASSGSLEKSRILIDFPLSEISSSRTVGLAKPEGIPASGSVNFYLRMYNAEHSQTLPSNYFLTVLPVSGASWDEGYGLDMESYTHKGVTNWLTASFDNVAQRLKILFKSATMSHFDDGYISLYDGEKKRYDFWFDTGNDSPPNAGAEADIRVDISSAADINALITTFNTVINNRTEFSSSFSTADASNRFIEVLNTTAGISRQPTASATLIDQTPDQIQFFTIRTGSNYTPWQTPGGDFKSLAYTSGQTLPLYKFPIDKGTEDIELDITALVEELLSNLTRTGTASKSALENFGLGIFLSGAYEDGTYQRSFYTKKFFARSSEFFFKRPAIEARWDNSILDDRARLSTANSQLSNADNTFNLYYYNWVNGQLKDFPNSAVPNFTLTTDKTLGNKSTLATDTTDVRLDVVLGKKLSPPGSNIDATSPDIADATLTINDGTNSRVVTFKNGAAGNASQVQMESNPTVATALTRLAAAINDTTFGTAVNVTAVVSGSTLRLTHDSAGTVTVTSSSANVGTSFPVSTLQNTASFITSTKTATGTYKASFIVPTNVTSSTLYEKWWISDETTGLLKGHNGTCPVNIKQFYTMNQNIHNSGIGPQDKFVTSITNLKDSYSRKERIKFRVSVRENNWQPNIYSVAQNTPELYPIIKGYYKIERETDNLEVVGYSTGSLGYSRLSYDNFGNYFDFDMSLLKEDFTYNICFMYDVNGTYTEQKERFKFRVHK